MSLTRKLRRAAARKNGTEFLKRTQPYRLHGDGGYSTLHPTNGWKRFSSKRLAAQAALRALNELLIAKRLIRG